MFCTTVTSPPLAPNVEGCDVGAQTLPLVSSQLAVSGTIWYAATRETTGLGDYCNRDMLATTFILPTEMDSGPPG